MRVSFVLCVAVTLAVSIACHTAAAADLDFRRDVLPILADACFQCHGPDEAAREADLRLDLADGASDVIDVPSPENSELILRIVETDPEVVMPPPESGKSLTAAQIETLKQWVASGARYERHWAFVPPQWPEIPAVNHAEWVRNPIDAFVARRLESEQLSPSRRADPVTLVRRLWLDLIGLPPTPDEVDLWVNRFRQDPNDGYDALVSHLLDSPHYGERWTRLWLDAARYADSDGYEKDKPRTAWFYRDWVIDSLNSDRPYDDFIIRQIAGDLLPGARQSDLVATGFLRNSMVNEEGGADPEQFRMEAMFDRMDAVGKSVLGLTIQCAQCHSHKYDPLTHQEYYQLFACLNNTDDAILPVYTPEEEIKRREVIQRVRQIESDIKKSFPDYRQRMQQWEDSLADRSEPQWQTPELSFLDSTLGGSKFQPQPDGSYLCQSYAPTSFKPKMTGRVDGDRITAVRLDLLTHPNLPRGGPGRSVDGTWALSEITAEYELSSAPGKVHPIKFAWAGADLSPHRRPLGARYDNRKKTKRVLGPIEYAIDGDETTAWTNEVGEPRRNTSQTARFQLEQPIEIPDGEHAIVHLYLAQRHGGWNSDDNQTINLGRFKLSFTGDAIEREAPLPLSVVEILSKPADQRDSDDWDALFRHWRTTVDELAEWNTEIAEIWSQHPLGTTQLALSRRSEPRETYLLTRGDFLSPQEAVEPGVPEFMHPLRPSTEPARLRLARWLVSRQSPTTARSIVNRIWQAYFGIGLVETSDDLGTQSAPPSHPELLDFMAMELMENGWSLKHLHRMIVSSSTYQQASTVTPELQRLDPYNRLLARGARFRVPAETVRDIALAASGLLCDTVGGPSVFPPAPEFLFTPPVSYGPKTWDTANDENRYRRALYTFRFRSVPYPMLENFDATTGNVSCVRRSTSNTPMQALTALNEPMFQECAVAMAAEVLKSASSDSDRLTHALRRCVARKPRSDEGKVLSAYLKDQRQRLAGGELNANEIISSGPKSVAQGLDDAAAEELAIWTLVCRVLLNLDETITRQ